MHIPIAKAFAGLAVVALLVYGIQGLSSQHRIIDAYAQGARQTNIRTAQVAASDAAKERELAPQAQSVALFVGDSYADGYDGVPKGSTFASLTCKAKNWICNIDAVGGTGYMNGKTIGADYVTRFAKTRENDAADYVFVSGGRNDFAKGFAKQILKETISGYMESVRDAYPKAKIYALEPFWVDSNPPAEITRIRQYAKAAAAEANATWIPTGAWLNGGLIGDDGVHPTLEGQREITGRIVAYPASHGVRPSP